MTDQVHKALSKAVERGELSLGDAIDIFVWWSQHRPWYCKLRDEFRVLRTLFFEPFTKGEK